MAALLPASEKNFEFQSRIFKFSRLAYDGSVVTFKVDQNAEGVATVLPVSGAPGVSLSASDSNFEKTVTLASGSSSASVIVVTSHGKTVAGAKA